MLKPADEPIEASEAAKPRENTLRKNHFKEVVVPAITIEHSKPKHIHQKWQIDKNDESAADSWKVEQSDKGGTDSEDIGRRPKKVRKGTKPTTVAKRPKPEETVLEQSSEKATVDGDQEVNTDAKTVDELSSKQSSFVEA